MFPRSGFLSARTRHAGVVLAAATFALGLGVGATIGPVTSSRNGSEVSAPVLAETARSFETNRVVHPAEVLRGIDAPEWKARCGEERVKAEAAREALRTILDQGEVSTFRSRSTSTAATVVADRNATRCERRTYPRRCSAWRGPFRYSGAAAKSYARRLRAFLLVLPVLHQIIDHRRIGQASRCRRDCRTRPRRSCAGCGA